MSDFCDHKDMVLVSAGEFTMGSTPAQADPYKLLSLPPNAQMIGNPFEEELPQHKVWLDDYYIDICPVTNTQYKTFCDATGHLPSIYWEEDGSIPRNREQYAVVGISWYDAVLYADWAGKRLPTEAEWEKAARGTDGRLWPWGDNLEYKNANFIHSNSPLAQDSRIEAKDLLCSVGSYPDGVSPYGCLDMAGNVWEWCSDRYDKNYYEQNKQRNPRGPQKGGHRVLRGGACGDIPANARCASRLSAPPTKRSGAIGFRCATSLSFEQTRTQSTEDVEEAKKFRQGSSGSTIALQGAGILLSGLLLFILTGSLWFAAFAAYYGGTFTAGIAFMLEKRNRLAVRFGFELVHIFPPVVFCMVAQMIWHLAPLSVSAGFLAGYSISRQLLIKIFPDIYDEYDIKPGRTIT